MNKCTAIILAAGVGKRLGVLTKDKPKALIEINRKPLIEYAINFVKEIGADEIIVVGGCYFEDLKRKVNSLDSNIKLVNNKRYKMQNLLSVYEGLKLVDDNNIFICNVDYIKQQSTIDAIKKNLNGIKAYCSFDLKGDLADVMKIKLDKNNKLQAISKKLNRFDCIYTGDFFCEKKYLKIFKKTAAIAIKKVGKKKAVTEHIFLELNNMGYKVEVADVGAADWFEIDTVKDLALAIKAFNKK